MKTKESFIFYYSWEEVFEGLTPEKSHELLLAILAFEKRGEEYAGTDEMIRLLFSVLRPQLESNSRKYERTCAARAEAGRKGGLATAENRRKANAANSAKPSDNEYEHEYEHENEHEHEHEHVRANDDDDDSPAGAPAVAEEAAPAVSSVVVRRFAEQIGGRMSRAFREELALAERELGTDAVLRAIDEASDSAHRSAKYIRGILRNWRREGIGGKGSGAGRPAPLPADDLCWLFPGVQAEPAVLI